MRCPNCKQEVKDFSKECPYCKINFEDYEYGLSKDTTKGHSYWLNIMANINLILSIVVSIVIFAKFSTMTVNTSWYSGSTKIVINWWGVAGGIALLIGGLTLFFLLKTVIDIYEEINKK